MKNTVIKVTLTCLLTVGIVPSLIGQDVKEMDGTVIGVNDSVTIEALGAEDISKTWRVSSTGELTLPLVGKIQAAGKTTDQFEKDLVSKLSAYIRTPEVTAYISEFRSETVTIAGAVDKPGRYQTEGKKTLLAVLMMAGGTKSSSSMVNVTRAVKYGAIPLPGARKFLDGNSSSVDLSVSEVLDASTAAANLIMKPDDVVTVSAAQRLIYILGEVNHAGAVELVTQNTVSIIQVVAAAGGTTKIASTGKTKILRKDSEGRYAPSGSVDLKKILAGKNEDKLLLPGDIVIVPSNNTKFYLESILMAATTSGVTTGMWILTRF
jgi:polysaccharide biosynthesis/export protein